MSRLGTPLYLLEKFEGFWNQVIGEGHELGWHPHLYRQSEAADEPALITDDVEACDEIQSLWEYLAAAPFTLKSFRNGEGWHSSRTFTTVESLGFNCDSTAIPGRCGGGGHPMNWAGAPNRPYYPARDDIRAPGQERRLLELPMTTWLLQAPYERRATPMRASTCYGDAPAPQAAPDHRYSQGAR